MNGDGKISQEEALIFMAKHNSDGKAELSRKEFGQLEKETGDMGRGERKLLNNDFLKTVFGTEDVQITTDGNKKTFKTQDGKVLGTVEQDGDNYTIYEAGKKTHTMAFKGNNITTTMYDETGERITKQVEKRKDVGTMTTEYGDKANEYTVTYSGDNLIAQNKGIIKEDYSEKDGLQFRVLTDINGKQTTEFSMNGKMWLSEDVLKAMQAPVENKEVPKAPVEQPKPKLGESLEKFGNKVTIDEDGSSQRLSKDKQWETSVRIPKGAETNENGAPTRIQIGLPSSYGKNAFQTLKLVDPENNIYEDRSGNRRFQVNITDDGVTLKHIDIDNDKVKAFLDANEKPINGGELGGFTVVGKKGTEKPVAAGKDLVVEKAEQKVKQDQVEKEQPNNEPLAKRDLMGLTYKNGNSIGLSNDFSTYTMKVGNSQYKISSNISKYINDDGTFKKVPNNLLTDFMTLQGFGFEPLHGLAITTKDNDLGVEKNGTFYKLEDILSGKFNVE